MSNTYHGFVDNWLRNIKDVYHKNEEKLLAIKDQTERANLLTELNVVEQVRNLAKTTIVQAWATRELHLHGWVYGLSDGLVKDLSVIHNGKEDIDKIYQFNIAPAPKEVQERRAALKKTQPAKAEKVVKKGLSQAPVLNIKTLKKRKVAEK